MVLFEAKTINANVKNETLKKLRNMEKIVDEEEEDESQSLFWAFLRRKNFSIEKVFPKNY